MAFPETPLGLKVEIQPGGVWTDITTRCKTSDPIVHTRGIRNKGTVAEPATVPLKIDNRDGAFSPRNPVSPYYGFLGLNTPARLWIPGGTHFLDLDGDSGSYASTPDHASLDITGDLDLRWEGEANWYGPGATMLIGKWGASGDRSYHMRLQDGGLYMQVQRDASAFVFTAGALPALPERAALRSVLDADNGAGSWAITLYWAASLAGPWTPLGTFTGTSSPVTVHTSTAPLQISGSHLTATPPRRPLDGKVYAAEVRNGIDGTVVASPDFEAQPSGTAPFADSAGRTWSYSGRAAIADRQDIFIGEISSWPQRWVPSEQAVWTPVTASGMLRRLGQGAKPLDSTLRRRIPSASPIAYWPFEDDREASRAYSPTEGVNPASVTGIEWASVDTLPASKPLPRLTAAATLSAIVPDATDGAWQVEMVYNADDKAPPAAGPRAEFLSLTATGTVRRWLISMRKDSIHVTGYDASGTDIINQAVTAIEDLFHGWFRLRLYAQDLGGGQMEWVIGWANVNGGVLQLAKTITGTPGHVTAITANWGALTEGWSIGHLSVMPTAANTIYDGSDTAYSGETAWQRMRRLAGEQGVPMARIPGELAPERVGPQRIARLVELFQAAADADGGMLLEDRTRRGLIYRERSSMYTQEPALTLTYKQPPLAPPLEPDDDADVARNDRTVKRDGGSEARAFLPEGRLSVQDPPDGIGLYDDSVTLSLDSDTQTEPIAYWLLHLGTYDGARYPSVTIRLHRAPEAIPAVLALREGDLIRIQGLPGFVAYGDVDLIVTGWSETLKPRTWERTFTCEPGGPWNTAVADHAVYGKAGTDGSQLAAAVTSTATTLPVTVTAGPAWTTNPAELPIDIEVGGETMTVDSVPAAASDTFTRTLANTWGTSSGGAVWTEASGAASDRSVNGTKGIITLAASVDTVRRQILATGITDAEVLVSISVGQVSTGSSLVPGVLLRHTDASNFYRCRLHFRTDNGVYIVVTRGSTEQGAQVNTGLTYTPGETFWLRTRVVGDTVFGRTWKDGTTEPATWQIERTITTTPIASGGAGLSGSALTGTTNVSPTISYDDFALYTPRFAAGISPAVRDIFDRTVSGGWGTADVGGTWTTSGGTGTDYSVGSGIGVHTLASVNVSRRSLLPAPAADFDLYCDIATDQLATGSSLTGGIIARAVDGDNLYTARLQFSSTQTITLSLRKRVTATETELATLALGLTHVATTFYRIRFQGAGSTLRAKAWQAGAAEPGPWQVTATDTALTAAANLGCRSIAFAANTNTNPQIRYDNLTLAAPQAFTVVRSVNGVVKAHPAGEPVALAHPAIASL